jgi:hypothetical protein
LTDALEPMRRAVREAGPACELGTPTTGHWCSTCQDNTLIVADIVRLTTDGPVTFALITTCNGCCNPAT